MLFNKFDSIQDRILRFGSLPSTNEYCKEKSIPHGAVVIADSQSRGHGRMGRCFSSEAGGLYISFCYRLDGIMPDALLPVTGRCAVAVIRSLRKLCGIDAEIKWTNDIILRGKKICGILAETVFSSDTKSTPEKLIIGIGINCNQNPHAFEGELKSIASSIFSEIGQTVDLEKLAVLLTEEIDKIFLSISSVPGMENQYTAEYRRYCLTIGKEIKILRPSLCSGEDPRIVFLHSPDIFPSALAVDIDDNFGLIVKHGNGETEVLTYGEVSIR
ncbi:MAG: biotin--[acetyl-CoA-carboxylase] ligase [Clostridia bacterium]|nr:biotin--[acetyl-CoA-carboxylase] ligase [Clostridia bacterium]